MTTAVIILLILVLWTVLGFFVAFASFQRGLMFGKDTSLPEKIAVFPVTVIVWAFDKYQRYIRR